MPQRYISKPVAVEAMRNTEGNRDALIAWLGEDSIVKKPWDPVNIEIRQFPDNLLVHGGEWVIKDKLGMIGTLDHETFSKKYSPDPQVPLSSQPSQRKPA